MGNDYVERERKSNIDINERRRLLRTKQSNEMNRLRQRQQQQIQQLAQRSEHRVRTSDLSWGSLNPLWESESPQLYRSSKPFSLKGGEVKRWQGIEPSTGLKLQWTMVSNSANSTVSPFSQWVSHSFSEEVIGTSLSTTRSYGFILLTPMFGEDFVNAMNNS